MNNPPPQSRTAHASAIEALLKGISGFEQAISALQDTDLGQSFDAAVDLIRACRGRVIVVGIGKSGHIAAKMAATFASTGTPAFFVHPTEASHGDLGMIAPDDMVLMVSWSGETRELQDIIGYCKRFSVPILSITRRADSLVARASRVALVLPEVPEACPNNLAPTISTQLQLAFGDALAVALVEQKGFTHSNFRDLHPGGKLGASLIPVRDLMLTGKGVPLIDQGAMVKDGLTMLTSKSMGIIGLTDATGALAGVVTDGDIRRYLERSGAKTMQQALHDTALCSIMSRNSISIPPDLMAIEALAVLQEHSISALFVLESDRPVGVVTFLTLLKAGVA